MLVSAPASGHGKTTVVAAFARLLTRQGKRVRVFKYGPDFLDPAWHALASGAPVHNIDLWMTGEADIRRRLYEAAAEADLIIVEGVMGLYDGAPSAAELARRLDLPVMTVIDAGKMAGTFGALAHGLQSWMPGLRWAGALANRVASPRHAQMLESSLLPAWRSPGLCAAEGAAAMEGSGTDRSGIVDAGVEGADRPGNGWLGAVFRDERFGLPSRHLGLIAGSELPDAMARLDAAADALADTVLGHLDEARLSAWMTAFQAPVPAPSASVSARAAGIGPVRDSAPESDIGRRAEARVAGGVACALPLAGQTIAVARDAAFSFIYPANLDTLQALGARLCFFSPLAGESLPACEALWLPGGYPELHAGALSANRALGVQIAAHVEAGKPVWAECGGMLPLFEQLDYEEGSWPMWGVLPGRVRFQNRLAGLGMQQLSWPPAQAPVDGQDTDSARVDGSEEGVCPQVLRGHTFHYSRIETPLDAVARSSRPNEAVAPDKGEAVYRHRRLHASYFHAWFASAPEAVADLFRPAATGDAETAAGEEATRCEAGR